MLCLGRALVLVLLMAQLLSAALAMDIEDVSALSIEGTIDATPQFQQYLSSSDRLIIKIFHPENGIEMDAKYSIVRNFQLPLKFRITPYILMDRSTRHEKYIIEVFTDKDKDLLRIESGELFGTTPDTIQLGSRDVKLLLNQFRK
ncbi:uncharacterized protein METZ01_LOCUS285035 [marine metagenome]|uniref:Uncharacterized protein n=1 Tax=marine metagenome TaxID=408172 RepID=A0A382LBD5_9ZZZZ